MIQAVLFDMDGVLTDSEIFITRAGVELFREKGFRVSQDDFKEFTGMGENRFLGGVAKKNNIPFDLEKDKARAYDIYQGLAKGRLKALPGVYTFIELCKSKGLKTALATSADRIKMLINLTEIGLNENSFDTTINGLEVKNKKPDPEIFISAASRLNLNPEFCLVVEDSMSGIKAAKKAGCKCLALTTSFQAGDLKEADWIASSLAEAPEECLAW